MSIFDDTRAGWHARPADGFLSQERFSAPISTRAGRTWHYDGGIPLNLGAGPHSACLAKVRWDQGFHLGKGWGDIGYQGLVCPHGRAIEGRSLDLAGAHCPGLNHSHVGFQIMVGGDEEPTDLALARAATLAADVEHLAGHDLSDNVHSDGYATTCPGTNVTRWVRAGGPEEGTDMTTDDSVRRIVREEIRAALRVELTDFQREQIGTGMRAWPASKMLGYLGGQGAATRKHEAAAAVGDAAQAQVVADLAADVKAIEASIAAADGS